MRKTVFILLLALLLAIPALAAEAPAGDAAEAAAVTADPTAFAALDAAEVDESVFAEVSVPADAALEVKAPSAILLERSTGTVLWEKNADERLEPASVTKVMTLLLAAEAVDAGAVSPEETVICSAYAASMGGSQVYLEEGERMSLGEMVKCIAVSSANDASVAVAEHLCGSEAAFVARMNERAAELGMTQTTFSNCTGLPGEEAHLTTARDIAVMSRELLRHDWVRQYTSIWMDTIREGEFGLANTNKLIYYYDGATGLKTGFTQNAGYCLAASAMREGVEYVAVVLRCESSADRFESAKVMLSFAFANYTLLTPALPHALAPIPVELGAKATVQPVLDGAAPLLVTKAEAALAETRVALEERVSAPVAEGQQLGTLTLASGGRTLASLPLTAAEAVPRLTLWQLWGRLMGGIFLACPGE